MSDNQYNLSRNPETTSATTYRALTLAKWTALVAAVQSMLRCLLRIETHVAKVSDEKISDADTINKE